MAETGLAMSVVDEDATAIQHLAVVPDFAEGGGAPYDGTHRARGATPGPTTRMRDSASSA